MLQLHAKQPAGKLLQNGAGDFDTVLFTHKPPELESAAGRSEIDLVADPAREKALRRRDVGCL